MMPERCWLLTTNSEAKKPVDAYPSASVRLRAQFNNTFAFAKFATCEIVFLYIFLFYTAFCLLVEFFIESTPVS